MFLRFTVVITYQKVEKRFRKEQYGVACYAVCEVKIKKFIWEKKLTPAFPIDAVDRQKKKKHRTLSILTLNQNGQLPV